MRMMLAGFAAIGLLPLGLALRANRGTSLAHAILWAIAAWVAWGVAFALGNIDEPGMDAGRYCALCLTGCAGVAVLGARRPHVLAWNFVVLGLFAVMVLPLAETLVLGTNPHEDWLRIVFLAATLTVGVLNYVPTRFAPAAVWLLAAGAAEIAFLYAPSWFAGFDRAACLHLLLPATPWVASMCLWRREKREAEFDRLWLSFRDRWGLFWSQRVRAQFNRAARHAEWPVLLTWRGLVLEAGERSVTPAEEVKIVETLRATLQRFVASDNK